MLSASSWDRLDQRARQAGGTVQAITVGPTAVLVIGPDEGEAERADWYPDQMVSPRLPILEHYAAELVNRERVTALWPSKRLQWIEQLAAVARRYGRQQLATGRIDHIDVQGRGPDARLDAEGVSYAMCGENIAFIEPISSPDMETVDHMHHGLMNSPGHRNNIMLPDFRFVGIGLCWNGRGLVMTQVFTGVTTR